MNFLFVSRRARNEKQKCSNYVFLTVAYTEDHHRGCDRNWAYAYSCNSITQAYYTSPALVGPTPSPFRRKSQQIMVERVEVFLNLSQLCLFVCSCVLAWEKNLQGMISWLSEFVFCSRQNTGPDYACVYVSAELHHANCVKCLIYRSLCEGILSTCQNKPSFRVSVAVCSSMINAHFQAYPEENPDPLNNINTHTISLHLLIFTIFELSHPSALSLLECCVILSTV